MTLYPFKRNDNKWGRSLEKYLKVQQEEGMQGLSERTVDQVGVEERAARLKTRSIKKSAKVEGLKLAISMMDLTTLEGKDTHGKVVALCHKAMRPQATLVDLPSVAAVCVYPNLVAVAKKTLAGSLVKVASVATGFPAGQVPLAAKLEDVRLAVAAGADEIDMVIDRAIARGFR